MTHINIYGPQKDPQRMLETLAKLACFQPSSESAIPEKENPYTQVLNSTLGVLKDLGESPITDEVAESFHFETVKEIIQQLVQKMAQRSKERAEITAQLNLLQQTKMQLLHLKNMQATLDDIFKIQYLKVRFGRLPKDSFAKLAYYAEESFTFHDYDFDGEYYWGVYFVPQNQSEKVDEIFRTLYFERIRIPDFVHGTPQDAIAYLEKQEAELTEKQKEIADFSDIISEEQRVQVKKIAVWLNYIAQVFEMRKYVIQLEHSCYISGFVPHASVETVRTNLQNLPGVRLSEDNEEAIQEEANAPPVRLKNNWIVRPFEMFIEMYGLPAYSDIDPTIFVAITYSVLFGAMFGDVGQGCVLGLVAYFIMYRKMHMPIGLVLTRCSVFSIVFGFLYGSVFGYEHLLDPMFHALGFAEKPIEVLDMNGSTTLLVASIVAGVFLLTVSMITGILSCIKRKQLPRAIFSVNGLCGLVVYLGLIAVLLKLALNVNIPFVGSMPFYLICLGLPLALIYFSHPICEKLAGKHIEEGVGEILMNGFFELFDMMLSIASNTMSFLRVGGFTLVHAGMMLMVFTIADMTSGPVYWIVVVLGNVLIMGIEALFVGIQVLRLEFYEMFSRFFEADGKEFAPLCIKPINL